MPDLPLPSIFVVIKCIRIQCIVTDFFWLCILGGRAPYARFPLILNIFSPKMYTYPNVAKFFLLCISSGCNPHARFPFVCNILVIRCIRT